MRLHPSARSSTTGQMHFSLPNATKESTPRPVNLGTGYPCRPMDEVPNAAGLNGGEVDASRPLGPHVQPVRQVPVAIRRKEEKEEVTWRVLCRPRLKAARGWQTEPCSHSYRAWKMRQVRPWSSYGSSRCPFVHSPVRTPYANCRGSPCPMRRAGTSMPLGGGCLSCVGTSAHTCRLP